MTTFPTPPLKKILKAWTYLTAKPSSLDNSSWLSVAGDRKTADRKQPGQAQTVADAQVILDAHSDST